MFHESPMVSYLITHDFVMETHKTWKIRVLRASVLNTCHLGSRWHRRGAWNPHPVPTPARCLSYTSYS